MKHIIKFYPVGNGDCDLITIGGANKKMMFDCNFRQKAEEDNEEMYDVLGDLLTNELTTRLISPVSCKSPRSLPNVSNSSKNSTHFRPLT